MDLLQQRDLIYGLRNISRCLDCTREEIIIALQEGGLLSEEEAGTLKNVSVMLDNADRNTGRKYHGNTST